MKGGIFLDKLYKWLIRLLSIPWWVTVVFGGVVMFICTAVVIPMVMLLLAALLTLPFNFSRKIVDRTMTWAHKVLDLNKQYRGGASTAESCSEVKDQSVLSSDGDVIEGHNYSGYYH